MSSEPLRVLFVSLRWDYGDPRRGDSFEYENLFDALQRMSGIEARFFGLDERAAAIGSGGMNAALVDLAQDWQPGLVFFFLFKDEISPRTLEEIRALANTTTLNWFADDHWRFGDFSRHWAPLFDWVVTTDARAVPRYARAGVRNVIHSQWGVNHHIYAPASVVQRDIDVSFIGQPYGTRRSLIELLRTEGITVETWGHGWENGRVTQSELVEILDRSKISLNFSASSPRFSPRDAASRFLRRRGSIVLPRFGELTANASLLRDSYRPQLKARNFEIAASGALLVTEQAPQLGQYLLPGVEAITFRGRRELVRKVRFYLEHDADRERVARAGTARTLRDHTYEQRFRTIFERVGFLQGR